MICLDTNFLVRGLIPGSREARRLVEWAGRGESFCAPAAAWYEFLCGPVNERQVEVMQGLVREIMAFDERQARLASQLFNAAGRKRYLRVDAMIAAAALVRGVPLATDNIEDFKAFQPAGLIITE